MTPVPTSHSSRQWAFIGSPPPSHLLTGVPRSLASRELRELLHLRLKYTFTIGTVVFAGFFLSTRQLYTLNRFITVSVILLCFMVPAMVLWLRQHLSLAYLRGFDLLLVTIGFTTAAYNSITRVGNIIPVLQPIASPLIEGVNKNCWYLLPDGSVYASSISLILANTILINWSLFAIGYSVLIPNTWRRASLIMGSVVVAAELCILYASFRYPALRGAILLRTLLYNGSLVSGFAAIGFYGSYKLSVLRGEALAARQLGQYSLKQQLGKGGMGEVYLAQHRMLQRPCAIKLIRPEQAGDASCLARFEREVQAMARLTHPNTVEVYDYGRTEDDTFYYAMEFLPGMTLEDLVRLHGQVTVGRALHFLLQLCGALGEAHTHGLIHRDVKPANVFVCERGGLYDFIKVLDFGLVRDKAMSEITVSAELRSEGSDGRHSRDAKLTEAGYLLGTPAYMSPEQLCGEEVDARTDIYGVGGVACYLLTGSPPYGGSTAAELCVAHLSQPPPLLHERCADIPEDLDSIVGRCLAKVPAQRFQSVGELAAALSACQTAGEAKTAWSNEQAARCWESIRSASTPAPRESIALDQTQADPRARP